MNNVTWYLMPVEPLCERFYLDTFPLQFLVIPVGRHVIFNGAYVSWSYIQDTEPIKSGVKSLPALDPGLAFPALGNLVTPLLPSIISHDSAEASPVHEQTSTLPARLGPILRGALLSSLHYPALSIVSGPLQGSPPAQVFFY